MSEFDLTVVKNDYESHSHEMQKILEDIKQIIINANGAVEGNCFYRGGGHGLTLVPDLYPKQLNLFWCGKQASTKICEIGFNAGHSSMLMLLGRDSTPLDFTIFDICEHRYTIPCLEYMKLRFQHINFEIVQGDSTVNMPKWIEANQKHLGLYDVVHVDGGHSEHCIHNDMGNADILVKKGGIVIIDDTDVNYINNYVNLYISSGKYREMDVLNTTYFPHRIIQKLL
jgi:hypothetical protein